MTDTPNTMALQPLAESLNFRTVAALKKAIAEGKVSIVDIQKQLLPNTTIPFSEISPAPLPVALTEDQKAAIRKVNKVFGSVVPAERRALTPTEVAELFDERQTLDEVERLAADRKKAIRTTVLNHIDVERRRGLEGVFDERDKEGHHLIPAKVPVPGTDKEWSWEIRNNAPSIDAEVLKELVESGQLDHKTYLRITEPVRVLNEDKLLKEIAKNPSIIGVVVRASVPGNKIGSLNIRKQS